jgi:hypothetical protein
MKFYLYLARDLFRPMLGARLFRLKDGGVREVRLRDEDVLKFEEELLARIERGRGKVNSMRFTGECESGTSAPNNRGRSG